MSLRNIKKLQSPDLFQHTDDSEESEATPRKAANNFELVSTFAATFSAKFSLRESLVDGAESQFDYVGNPHNSTIPQSASSVGCEFPF